MITEPDVNVPIEPSDTEHPTPEPPAGAALDAVRELVLRAHPDVVPELISGDSIETLLASVEPARAAWQRLAERFDAPPPVPAGGYSSAAIDPDRLPASEKIRRGLARGR